MAAPSAAAPSAPSTIGNTNDQMHEHCTNDACSSGNAATAAVRCAFHAAAEGGCESAACAACAGTFCPDCAGCLECCGTCEECHCSECLCRCDGCGECWQRHEVCEVCGLCELGLCEGCGMEAETDSDIETETDDCSGSVTAEYD